GVFQSCQIYRHGVPGGDDVVVAHGQVKNGNPRIYIAQLVSESGDVQIVAGSQIAQAAGRGSTGKEQEQTEHVPSNGGTCTHKDSLSNFRIACLSVCSNPFWSIFEVALHGKSSESTPPGRRL